MPADDENNAGPPIKVDETGWRRALQQTDSRRLPPEELRRYESEAKVIRARTEELDEEDEEDLADRAAILEACAAPYYRHRTETMSPKGADSRADAIRITEAAKTLLEAVNHASDITLDRLDKLGGEVGASYRSVIRTLDAAKQLIGPAPAGRPPHKHLDKFVENLAKAICVLYDSELKVYFTDGGQPIPDVSELLWKLVKHFDPSVSEASLRTAMRRAREKLENARQLAENP